MLLPLRRPCYLHRCFHQVTVGGARAAAVTAPLMSRRSVSLCRVWSARLLPHRDARDCHAVSEPRVRLTAQSSGRLHHGHTGAYTGQHMFRRAEICCNYITRINIQLLLLCPLIFPPLCYCPPPLFPEVVGLCLKELCNIFRYSAACKVLCEVSKQILHFHQKDIYICNARPVHLMAWIRKTTYARKKWFHPPLLCRQRWVADVLDE